MNYHNPGMGCLKFARPGSLTVQYAIIATCSLYNLHTLRPRIAHANTLTPNAYATNTHIARVSDAYIVHIDRFTTPVATFACSAPPKPTRTPHHPQTLACV